MKTGTTVHASVAIFVYVAFLGMLVLGVSPKLHSRVPLRRKSSRTHLCSHAHYLRRLYPFPSSTGDRCTRCLFRIFRILVLNPVWVQPSCSALTFSPTRRLRTPDPLILSRGSGSDVQCVLHDAESARAALANCTERVVGVEWPCAYFRAWRGAIPSAFSIAAGS